MTIKRLSPTDWDEYTVTYDNFDISVDQVGPSFDVRTSDDDTWLRIEISDLFESDVGDELLLMLEVTSTPHSSSHFKLSSRESPEYSPYIEVYPITEAPTSSPSISSAPSPLKSLHGVLYPIADTYIRSGANNNKNYGSETGIVVKNDVNLVNCVLGKI